MNFAKKDISVLKSTWKLKPSIILGFTAILVFSLMYGFSGTKTRIYDNNADTAQYFELGVLSDGQSAEQAFICEENILNGIYIKCGTSGEYEDAGLNIELINTATGETIAESSADGSDIKSRRLHKFSFNPVKGCKGAELTLVVTESNCDTSNGITLYYQPSDDSGMTLSANGEVLFGVLAMASAGGGFNAETFFAVFVSLMFIWIFMYFLSLLFR